MARASSQESSSKWYVLLALGVLIADQITKWWAQMSLPMAQAIKVTDFLNWFLIYNPGAAFSFLSQADGWQRWFFTVIGIVAAVVIIWLLQKNTHDRPFCLALSLILGGAIGNVLDRLLYGAVVDFIDVHYDGWHWPAFNIADSAISIGATLIVINEIRRAIKDRP
ncbi:signal peptidase II [Polynucleobacter sp. HIN5]|uniref:signal peptidase II n=1 Tax=Polynucleobacter sp. HIN5 TaxID=3047864 RepID=UPI002572C641|nr:signal peptidase II [Polynucleobacter sp. HIN5]BEI34135.1 signal peptidase II [Polynucleobacter sp. HIN5]